MKYYTVLLRLTGALSGAVAVEWTNQAAPVDSGQGWEPCLRLDDGAWRFSSHAPFGANPAHRRSPGAFGDLAIRYRLAAAGPWSAAAAPRREIIILEVTETEEAPDAPQAIAPMLALAPALVGLGKIGTEISVAPGLWGGDPAPRLGFQWRRNGVAIPGAAARAYVPGPADDLTDLDCAVTAVNASGQATAATAAVRVTYRAPAVFGTLPEEVFDEDTGPQTVAAAAVFAGANLTFSATGAVINPQTGVLTIPTGAPVSGQAVTVTATNSGGQASASFTFTVEAAPAPDPLIASDVTVVRSDWRPAGQTTTFSPILAFPGLTAAERAVAEIQFRASPLTEATAPWHPVAALAAEPGRYRLPDSFDPAAPTFNVALWQDDARRFGRLRFRYRLAADQAWSTDGATLDVPLPAQPAATYTVATTSELVARMTAATDGQIIDMLPGNYVGHVFTSNLWKTGNVTIRAANPSNPPVFLNDEFSGSTLSRPSITAGGVTLRGFTFDGIVWRNTTQDRFGFPTGSATRMAGGQRLKFRNCRWEGFAFQLILSDSVDCTVEFCEFKGFAIDAMRFYYGGNNLLVRNNWIHDPLIDPRRSDQLKYGGADIVQVPDLDGVLVDVSKSTRQGRHPDCIQFSTPPTGDGGWKNVTIRNNRIETFNGYCHGLLMFNDGLSNGRTMAQNGNDNFVIEGNFLRTAHGHAITAHGVTNVAIRGNVIRKFLPCVWEEQNGSNTPGFSLFGNVSGVIDNNVAPNYGLGVTTYRHSGYWRSSGSYNPVANVTRTREQWSETALPEGWTTVQIGPYGFAAL